MTEEKKSSAQEQMKEDSLYLKGDILEELQSDKIAVSDYSYELLKFHGTYQGYDRDTATKRKKAGLDKEYEFMVRLRIPAGRLTAQQYLDLDKIAENYANDTLRITTRQTFQYHCIVKDNLKSAIHAMNEAGLSTLSACGDVVRNVTTTPSPIKTVQNQRMLDDVAKIVEFCEPKSTSYDEIWNDKAPGAKSDDIEPLYGKYYLPRKFKIGLIVPEDNHIDVFTHDLGFVLIYDGDELLGYNVVVGGGLGMTHNKPATYPRLATPIAFVGKDDLLNATEAVVKIHRDFGDRGNRKHARIKYVVEENGVDWTKEKFAEYFNASNPTNPHKEPVEVASYKMQNHLGWNSQNDGKYYVGVHVSSGRIEDNDNVQYRTAFREIVTELNPTINLTTDQNILFCDLEEFSRSKIEAILTKYNVVLSTNLKPLTQHFFACVALPTCGKALSEAERVKLPMEDDIAAVLKKHDVLDQKLTVRIAGCPNGCSRPYVGDIGIVGRMPGHYVIFIGGDFEGTRLNTQIFDKVPQKDVAVALEPIISAYAKDKQEGEGFGDFCHRVGIESLKKQSIEILQDYKWAV